MGIRNSKPDLEVENGDLMRVYGGLMEFFMGFTPWLFDIAMENPEK